MIRRVDETSHSEFKTRRFITRGRITLVSGIDTRVTDTRWPTRASVARLSGGAALVGIALTVLIFGALHLLPPTRDISPVHRTISEYALTGSAWAFDLAVILLACSSMAAFTGLVLIRRVAALSAGTVV